MRPRRLADASARPLNFIVRAHMQRLVRLLTLTGASKSLLGHLVFFQVICALPIFALLVMWDYQDHALGALSLARDALVCSAGGAIMAVVCWNVVTLPILRRTGRRP